MENGKIGTKVSDDEGKHVGWEATDIKRTNSIIIIAVLRPWELIWTTML